MKHLKVPNGTKTVDNKNAIFQNIKEANFLLLQITKDGT